MTSVLVIADDLTGAAEIGGIALRYNLTVDIVHEISPDLKSDVQILNSNTRSLKEDEIIPHLKHLVEKVNKANYQFIYLKFDSALRGIIKPQVEFLKEQLAYQTVIFSPANPVFGRTIKDGIYYINNTPINETGFAEDPEFPIHKSKVQEILKAPDWKLLNASASGELSEEYFIAEILEKNDLDLLAQKNNPGCLMGGGSAFFDALLNQKYTQYKKGFREHIELNYPILYVCGSAYESSVERIAQLKPEYLVYMEQASEIEKVVEELVAKIENRSRVVFAIDPKIKGNATELRKKMASIVARVYNKTEICELVIEGGATSFEILNELNIKSVTPVQEISLGLIKTMVTGKQLFITLKPGSYPWDKALWRF